MKTNTEIVSTINELPVNNNFKTKTNKGQLTKNLPDIPVYQEGYFEFEGNIFEIHANEGDMLTKVVEFEVGGFHFEVDYSPVLDQTWGIKTKL